MQTRTELEGWKPAGMGIHQVLCDAQYTEDESGKVTSAAYGMDLKSDEGKVLAWTHGPSEPMYQGVRVHEIVAALMGVTLSDEVRKLHLKYKLSDEEKKLFDIKHLEIVSDNEEAIEMMEEMRDEDSDISKQLDSRSGTASDEIKVLRKLRNKIITTFGFHNVTFRSLVREGNFLADSLGRRKTLSRATKTIRDSGFYIPGVLYFEFRNIRSNPENQKKDRQTFAQFHYIRFRVRENSPFFFVREKAWYFSGYSHGRGGGRRRRDDSILTGGNAGSQVKGGHDWKQVSTLAEYEYKPVQVEEKKAAVNTMSEERKLALEKQFVGMKVIGKKKEEELQLPIKKKKRRAKEQKDEKLQPVPPKESQKSDEKQKSTDHNKESEPPAVSLMSWADAVRNGGSQQQQQKKKISSRDKPVKA